MNTTHPLVRASLAVVVGRRGSGKSELLRRASARRRRVVVLDLLHGEPVDVGEPLDLGVIVYDEDEYRDALREASSGDRWRIVVRPDTPEDARWVVGALMPKDHGVAGYARAVRGVCVFSDEIDLWMPNHAGIDPAVRSSIARGRHYAVKIIGATRRPAECHRDLSSQADVLVTFQQHEPRDIAWLDKTGGRSFALAARTLGQYEYLARTADGADVRRYDGRDRQLPLDEDGAALLRASDAGKIRELNKGDYTVVDCLLCGTYWAFSTRPAQTRRAVLRHLAEAHGVRP